MELGDFTKLIPGFATSSHAERIKAFAWHLHVERRLERFRVSDIRDCFNRLHLVEPGNLARSIDALTEKSPPDLLKDIRGYRLAAHTRDAFDQRYGKAESTVTVEKALAELPGKISDDGERLFLQETLTCYRHGAFRATIVMAWNLAYDHLVRWILAEPTRLAMFNQGIAKRNPKKAHITIQGRDDFEELKEDEVVDIAANLPGISGGMKKVLKEKLGRRNTYAHPSTMEIAKPQVDDQITDLVNNVVLKLI